MSRGARLPGAITIVSEPGQAARPDIWLHRHLLPLKAVQVVPLDECDDQIRMQGGAKSASGFIRREATGQFLYVCWHTVTGIDPSDPRIPPAPVILPRSLPVRLQNVQELETGERIGGVREFCRRPISGSSAAEHWQQTPNRRVPTRIQPVRCLTAACSGPDSFR